MLFILLHRTGMYAFFHVTTTPAVISTDWVFDIQLRKLRAASIVRVLGFS